jgi:hypothetical protein
VLVIVALGMVALLAMVGLVIDGGYAWGRQRMTQSGADAVAEAGATVLAQNGAGTFPAKTDGDVGCAIAAAATANGLQNVVAYYTTWEGEFTSTPPMRVGPCVAGGGGAVPAGAGGIKASGEQTFDTFLMRIVGINTGRASADATAITGVLVGCPEGMDCPLAPITIQTISEQCDGSGKYVRVGGPLWPIVDPAAANATNEAIIALCKTDSGSFGGLDLGAPGCDSKDGFVDPCEASVDAPSWLQTSTGAIKNDIEGLNQYAGPVLGTADDEIILVPMHDATCKHDPPDETPPPCVPGDQWNGVGNNTFYHVPYLTGFMVDRGYKDYDECTVGPGQPLATGGNSSGACLKGWFVKLVLQGPVGGPASGNPQDPASIGVQLIN